MFAVTYTFIESFVCLQFFSDGRKPEKGEVKSIMQKLTSVKERGDLGGSPKCASYAEAVGGMRRKEEPPSKDEGAKAGAEAMADKEAEKDPKAVTGSSDEGVSEGICGVK